MSVSILQICPVFLGEVPGVDIAAPLAPDEVAAIEDGMTRYAALVCHDQKITDEQPQASWSLRGRRVPGRGAPTCVISPGA